MAFSPLPRLRTASKPDDFIEYSTGASYKGKLDGKKRKGSGTFYWPNGAKYEGEFSNNQRQGQGIQHWPDGSSYEGVFSNDLRHGQGTQSWIDGSKYVGTFFRDRRHGKGHYSWSDGSSFIGYFYIDKREGYGKFTYANGDVFQGLYRKDERFGPGVLTYTDGREDAGHWIGERLVKLLSTVSDSFSMMHHSELGYNADDHKKYIKLQDRHYNKEQVLDPIIHPPKGFDYEGNDSLEENSKGIFSDSLHPDSLAMDCEVFEEEFFGSSTDEGEKTAEAVNFTPIMVEIQKHIHRHKSMESSFPYPVSVFDCGPRAQVFKSPAGPLETRSTELINSCLNGDKHEVQSLLIGGNLSPDVADSSGFTPLQAAVTNCHQEIINMLLDAGADVNKLNDEGLSALAQCFVYYYPVETFKENIAESEYMIPRTNGADDSAYIEVIAARPSTSDAVFYHYVRRDRTQTYQNTYQNLVDFKPPGYKPPALVSTQKLSKEKLAKVRSAQSIHNKAQSANPRDSGFESRKDVMRPPTRSEGGSSAVTPASQDTRDQQVADSRVTSQAGSERDKSPSVISNITADQHAAPLRAGETMSEAADNNDELSSVDDEDEVSVISSQAMSQISIQGDTEFQSDNIVLNYGIEVKDDLIDRCATALSHNEMVTKRGNAGSARSVERMRLLAQRKAMKKERWETMQLLLRRGGNPNVCSVPMPALVFTIKAGDMEATKLLLLKGADANLRLPEKKGGLSPLHLAAGTPGEEGILITDYLLNALSDPDARATVDNSYLDPDDELGRDDGFDEWGSEGPSLGRTPLHIACSRDDDYVSAARVVHLLLDHKADPDVLCNGHTPLSLAIISGNDKAIEELLKYKANPSLSLTHGNGNALCVASHTAYEHRRSPDGRIDLIDKLVDGGADILAPVPIGPKKIQGTALDYAYHIFNLDRRIAHMPYHALSYAERETYNARRQLLSHMGDVVREKCVERERKRIEEEVAAGLQSRSPSARFMFTGSGAKLGQQTESSAIAGRPTQSEGRVKFEVSEKTKDQSQLLPTVREQERGIVTLGPNNPHNSSVSTFTSEHAKMLVRKPLFKYCYDCGRSVNVRLTACTRCKEVYFCSKTCKVKAWNARHKDECVRLQGSKNPSRATSNAKSAPAKYGGRGGAQLKNIDPRRAAKMEKSYNMMRRPTDRSLGPRKHLSNSHPNLAHGNKRMHRHTAHGGRMSPDLTPYSRYTDNYSFE